MKRFLWVTVLLLVWFESPVLAASRLWQPKPRPQTCLQVNTQAIAIDRSGSMKGRFPAMIQQLKSYVRSRPLDSRICHHIVFIHFDRTADVSTDEFLTDAKSRDRLIAELSSLKPMGEFTNFDEVAKAIRLVWLQLLQNPQKLPQALTVQVLTDGESSPSQGKKDFDLTKFLQQEIENKTKLSWRTIVVSPHKTVSNLKGNSVTVPVTSLSKFLEAMVAEQNQGTRPIPRAATEKPSPKPDLHTEMIVGILTVGILGLLCLNRNYQKETKLKTQVLTLEPITAEIVNGLSVKEIQSENTMLKILLVPDVPAIFGTKSTHHYMIRGLSKVDQLFSITATIEGDLFLKSQVGESLRCDGDPVAVEGRKLPGDRAFVVSYQQRSWSIEPSFDEPLPKRMITMQSTN